MKGPVAYRDFQFRSSISQKISEYLESIFLTPLSVISTVYFIALKGVLKIKSLKNVRVCKHTLKKSE